MTYTGGWKHWNPNDTFTSADVNNYFMSQAVPRFATTTARDAALTGADAPTTGQFCYVTGQGLMMWNGTSWGVYGAGVYTDQKLVTVAGASITFTGIPRTLKTVRINGAARGSTAGTGNQAMWMQVAGDTGTNYYYAYTLSTNATVTSAAAASTANAHICHVPNAGFGIWNSFNIIITGWDQPAGHTAGCTWTSTGGFVGGTGGLYALMHAGGSWTGSATLNQVTIFLSGANFVVGSVFNLMGEY